ncbi:electron transfer flavoprotein subunit beta/FixA family protein [Myxococcota bacterium]
MNILVLVKSVPEVAEAELEINDDGGLETEDLVFGINEWDNFAVEEAIRVKEADGATVAVLTVGDDEAEDVLRRALAMGADEAIHLNDEAFADSDPATVAHLVAAAINDQSFDLILTGVQSADANNAQTGVLLAQRLGLPYATLATRIEMQGDGLVVHRELESDTEERVELGLPAVVTVQSGINQPRYVSVMGIRKVRGKTVRELGREDLDVAETGTTASVVVRRTLTLPLAGGNAEMIEGSVAEVSDRLATVIREKGGLS